MFQIVSGMENFQRIEGRGAYHDSLSKLFCLTELKNLRRGTLICSKYLSASKFFGSERGVPRFSAEYFLPHSTETFHSGTL